MNFKNLNLINPIIRAATEAGYSKPTEMQYRAIPYILKGKDVLGCAQTDTGKIASFTMPVLQLLKRSTPEHNSIRTLILTPTREHAIQIEENFKIYSKYLPLSQFTIYRGVSQGGQLAALRNRIDILIATPEGLLDLIHQRPIDFSKIEVLVLDESDRMFDMGLITDVKKVLSFVPQRRQTLLFSATMPADIRRFADTILKNPVEIKVAPAFSVAQTIQQSVYFVNKKEKTELLISLLQDQSIMRSLVFIRTKYEADRLVKQLISSGISAAAIHGDKSQDILQKAFESFKNSNIRVLITTDIAARGIDIDESTYVVNYELPGIPELYIDRMGRAEKVVSFCTEDELADLTNIQALIGFTIPVALQNRAAQYSN